MSETEYISWMLGQVKRFAQSCGVHVWFIAHPAKLHRENGKLPAPTLYDISGSANWANKADLGVVVHRDPAKDPTRTDIYVRKVRFKSVGKILLISLDDMLALPTCFPSPLSGPQYCACYQAIKRLGVRGVRVVRRGNQRT